MLNQLLPSIGALALVAFNGFAVAQEDNIVTVAVDNGFEVLASALTAANLVGALQDPDANYTVFAPTDEAFAAVPQPILNWLLTPAGESALTDILLYHVVDGEFFSTDLSNGTIVPTLQGSTVEFTIDETVMVNDATVLIADVDASNGVIHVIDQVLIPEDLVFPKDIVDLAVDAGSFTMLVAAIEAAGLIDTLKGTGPFTVCKSIYAVFVCLDLSAHTSSRAFLLY
jgi:transforming growth factor-beta-induced protein